MSRRRRRKNRCPFWFVAFLVGAALLVGYRDYKGKLKLIYFGYTFCPDICPTELGLIAKALDALTPEQREKVAPLFITVDPERDTPQVLQSYTAAFHPQIIGLTGSVEQVDAAKKAFHIYAAKAPGNDDKSYGMDHSSILYILNGDGAYVAHFNRDVTLDQLVQELQRNLS